MSVLKWQYGVFIMMIDLFNYDKIAKTLLQKIENKVLVGNIKFNGQLGICAGELADYCSVSFCSQISHLNHTNKFSQTTLDTLYILCPPIASKQYINLLRKKLCNLSRYKPDRIVVYKPMLYSFPYECHDHLIETIVEENFTPTVFKYYIKPGVCFDSFIQPFLFMLSKKVYYDAIEDKRINFFMLNDLVEMLTFLGLECDKQYQDVHLTGPTNYDLEEVTYIFNQYLNTPFLYKNIPLGDLKSIYMKLGYSYFCCSQFILLTLATINNQFVTVSDDYMYLLGKAPKNIIAQLL